MHCNNIREREFRMMTSRILASLALCALAGSAYAVSSKYEDSPYAAGFGSYTIVDGERQWDDDFGYQVTFGLPLSWEDTALELSFFNGAFERDIDGKDDYHAGITVDLVRDFGGISFLSRTDVTPYALAGIGAVRDDVQGDDEIRPMANVGGGALFGLPVWGMGLRTEFRLIGQHESLSAPGASLLLDYRFLVGLQLPLSPLFASGEAPVEPLPEEEACEVAVVDPVTGRTDCRNDSDDDGVDDTMDQCPGTEPGVTVDEAGCPPVTGGEDSDGDGVMDTDDQCPDTFPGVTVNTAGCAEPQPLVLPTLTFHYDTARLTSGAQGVLDDVAAMLRGQQDLTIEIIGHTDSRGDDGYNQRLSEERAAAVKARLEGLGIAAARMSTTGRGESQPVASNETEEGRAANRRVTFWLYLE